MSSIHVNEVRSPSLGSHLREAAFSDAAQQPDAFSLVTGTKRKSAPTAENGTRLNPLAAHPLQDPSIPRADGKNAFTALDFPLELYFEVFRHVGNAYDLLHAVSRVSHMFRENVAAFKGEALHALLPATMRRWVPKNVTFAELVDILRTPHGTFQTGYVQGGSGNAGYPPVFSTSGGAMVATSRHGNVSVWDCKDNKLTHRGPLGGTWDASCAVFSADEKFIATAGGMHAHLNFFDVESLRCVGTLNDFADEVVFLDNTTVAAEQHRAGRVQIVRIPTGEGEIPAVLATLDVTRDTAMQNGHVSRPHCSVSADGRFLAAAAGTKLCVWSVNDLVSKPVVSEPETVEPLARCERHTRLIEAIAFAPESNELATMDDKNVLHFWRMGENGTTVEHQSALEPTAPPSNENYRAALVYDPSGKHVAATLGDGKFMLVRDPGAAPKRFDELRGIGPLFSPDGRFVTAIVGMSYYDKNAKVWRIDQAKASPVNYLTGYQSASSLVASPNGQLIVATDPTCCGRGVWTYQGKRAGTAGYAPPPPPRSMFDYDYFPLHPWGRPPLRPHLRDRLHLPAQLLRLLQPQGRRRRSDAPSPSPNTARPPLRRSQRLIEQRQRNAAAAARGAQPSRPS